MSYSNETLESFDTKKLIKLKLGLSNYYYGILGERTENHIKFDLYERVKATLVKRGITAADCNPL